MLKRNFKIVLDTAQSRKITVLSTAAMNAPPNLFNSVNIRHFDCLLFLVKSIMNSVNSSNRRDAAFFILTETDLADELSEHFPHGNLILREDYQRSFKAKTRFRDTKKFLKEYPRNAYQGSIFAF